MKRLIFVILSIISFNFIFAAGGTVPAGLPSYFAFGAIDKQDTYSPDQPSRWKTGQNASCKVWDYNYQYFVPGWTTWASPTGQWGLSELKYWEGEGQMMVATFYYSYGSRAYFQSTSNMNSYWADLKVLFQLINSNATKPVIIHFEPDGIGFWKQANVSATSTGSVMVGSCSGVDAALSGLPNSLQGWHAGIMALRDKYAPNKALIAHHFTHWATGTDLFVVDNNSDTQGEIDNEVKEMTDYIASIENGNPAELFFIDPSDRDAAWYDAFGSGGRWTDDVWDTSVWNKRTWGRIGYIVDKVSTNLDRKGMFWQIPTGNDFYTTCNNTDGHYKDDHAQEAFFREGAGGPGSGYSPTDTTKGPGFWASKGIIACLFGSGYYGEKPPGGNNLTHLRDYKKDGKTGDGPYSDDDGGYIRLGAAAYCAAGKFPLGGSAVTNTPTTPPTFTKTNTPVGPTYTPTRTYTTGPSPTFTNTVPVPPTSKLNLEVRATTGDACTDTMMQFDVRITNYDTAAVDPSTLEVRFWVNESAAIGWNGCWGGVVYSAAGAELGDLTNTTGVGSASCASQTQYGSITFSGPEIPANGGYAAEFSAQLHRGWQAPFDTGCDNYSKPGTTTYHNDPHWALYENGNLVCEWTSASTQDADTALNPCTGANACAAATSTYTYTRTSTNTPTRTNTPLPPTSTHTYTNTATHTATRTFTAVPPTNTNTAIPPTATHTFTRTATNTHTSTNTAVPPTFTHTHTRTYTNTNTHTATLIPTSTNTVPVGSTNTNTYTVTNTFTNTNTHTATRTNTPVPPTSTNTTIPSATNTTIPGSTNTFTFTITNTHTATHTPTATNTAIAPLDVNINYMIPSGTVTLGSTSTIQFNYAIANQQTNSVLIVLMQGGLLVKTLVADTIAKAPGNYNAELNVANLFSGVSSGSYTIRISVNNVVLSQSDFAETAAFSFVNSPTSTATVPPASTATHTFTNTHTPTSTSTNTAIAVNTATYTNTVPAITTATYTPTEIVTPAATESMDPKITDLLVYPNPYTEGKLKIKCKISKKTRGVSFKLYSASFRLLKEYNNTNPQMNGEVIVEVPEQNFKKLSNGTYYYMLSAETEAGSKIKSKADKFIIMK